MDMRDFELIVVDDCSTDQTVDIVSKNRQFSNYKFIQLDQNSGTPAKPRNLSIDLSKESIMFIDGDDCYLKML